MRIYNKILYIIINTVLYVRKYFIVRLVHNYINTKIQLKL